MFPPNGSFVSRRLVLRPSSPCVPRQPACVQNRLAYVPSGLFYIPRGLRDVEQAERSVHSRHFHSSLGASTPTLGRVLLAYIPFDLFYILRALRDVRAASGFHLCHSYFCVRPSIRTSAPNFVLHSAFLRPFRPFLHPATTAGCSRCIRIQIACILILRPSIPSRLRLRPLSAVSHPAGLKGCRFRSP